MMQEVIMNNHTSYELQKEARPISINIQIEEYQHMLDHQIAQFQNHSLRFQIKPPMSPVNINESRPAVPEIQLY